MAENQFLKGFYDNQAANQAQSQSELRGILGTLQVQGALQKMQQEQAYRSAISGAAPEDYGKIALQYGGPEAVMKHLDRQATTDNTKQVAISRLAQAAARDAATIQDRANRATSAQEKFHWQQQMDMLKATTQKQAADIAAGRYTWETGNVIAPFQGAVPSLPTPEAQGPSIPQAGPLQGGQGPMVIPQGPGLGALSGRSPEDLAAIQAVAQRGGTYAPSPAGPVEASGALSAMPNVAPQAVPRPGLGPQVPPMPAPVGPAPAPMPSASVLGPQVPMAAPAPSPAPAPMPGPKVPTLADAPAELTPKGKQQWLLKQTQGGGNSVLSAEALGPMAWEKLLFGTNPPGMGNASAAQRQQVNEERARLGRSLGLSDMEMAMLPQDNKVKMKAVDKLTTWGSFLEKSSAQLDKTIDIAIDYAKKMDPMQLQIVNRAIIAGKKEFNDPIANAYALQVNSIRQEYGRLMSGPTSNAMLPVEAMKKGDNLISMGLNVEGWQEMKAAILRDAAAARSSVQDQIGGLRGSIQTPKRRSGDNATPNPALDAALQRY